MTIPIPPSNSTTPVGFAGLGAMGYGMAVNLLKAGVDVLGLDPGQSARERFEAAGGSTTTSTAASCNGRSQYLIMVATPNQVDSLVFGPGGLVDNLPPRAIVCLCCTLPPTYVSALPERLSARGRSDIRVVDSPVSGGVVGAINGTLNIMMAGDSSAIEEIRATLQVIAAPGRLFYCGGLSTASTLKMLNQHLAGIHIISTAETLSFARALGLSTREAHQAVMRSASSSWIFQDRGAHMLEADWATKSAVDIFVKDLAIVMDCGNTRSFPCPLASQAYYGFLQASCRGYGTRDDSIVVRNYEEVIGKEVAEAPCLSASKSLNSDYPASSVRTSVLGDSFTGTVTFLEEHFVKRMAHLPDERVGRRVFIHIHDAQASKNVSMPLKELSEGSIVAVLGIRDTQQAESFVREVVTTHPQLTFMDIQVVAMQEDPNIPELLFSSSSAEVAEDIQNALQPHITCHPVSGPLGSATAMYLVLRLSALIHVAAAAECYGLTLRMGVSPELVYKVVAGAAGSSAQFNRYYPKMRREQHIINDHRGEDYSCDNSLDQALKDLAILHSTARSLKFPATLLNAAHQVFKYAHHSGLGERPSITALTWYWTKQGEA